jgi:electron transfer flavoprotein beta subunit
VTYVQNVELAGDKVIVQRQMEDGYELIEVKTPCLLTAVKELNEPRYMSIYNIVDACSKEITVWGHEDIKLSPENCGLKASPTQVFRSFTPPTKGKGEMLTGTTAEVSKSLISKLKGLHVI